MNVVIIEDEPRAANRLEKLIVEIEPHFVVVKKLESVKQSIQYFKGSPLVDLIFSDIQLTDDLSFEIYNDIQLEVPIIFTTAYDNYAINAFKANGIDYLLKPINKEDVKASILKFKRFSGANVSVQTDNLKALAELLQAKNREAHQDYKKRFVVKVGQHLKSISIHDIMAFYSRDKSTFLFTSDKRSYTLDSSLDQLEPLLDPAVFFRINRSYIVGLNSTSDILSYSNSRLKLIIEGLEDELIVVSRERTKAYKTWLGE